jgi:cell fate (sporulation/competence/biofilm development) regulator YmcA (YheA/YmcA/DUF963 family)
VNLHKSKEALIGALKENSYVKEFIRLEKIINENKVLEKEMLDLQEMQREIINLKKVEKYQALNQVERAYREKRRRLEENPVIKEYLALQQEMNDLLQAIKKIIEEELKIT